MKYPIKKTNGTYILFNEDEAVYVGSSSFCEKRISDHIAENKKEFTHFEITERVEKSSDLLKIETDLIAKYVPKYNMSIPIRDSMGTIDFLSKRYLTGIDAQTRSRIKRASKKILKPCLVLNGLNYYRTDDFFLIFNNEKK